MNLLIPPPIVALVSAGFIYSAAYLFPDLTFEIPFQTVFAALISLVGVTIDLVSVRRFFVSGTTVTPISPEKTSSLVTGGLYAFSRNPMYLGLAFILTGFTVWMANLAGFVVVAGFVLYITRFQIMPEEKVLSEKFGAIYEEYRSKTRRWL